VSGHRGFANSGTRRDRTIRLHDVASLKYSNHHAGGEGAIVGALAGVLLLMHWKESAEDINLGLSRQHAVFARGGSGAGIALLIIGSVVAAPAEQPCTYSPTDGMGDSAELMP
jgi:hypothetical protein